MTLYELNLLLPSRQLVHVLGEGTFLGQRSGATLYYLPDGAKGFFAEGGIDEAQGGFVVVHSFSSSTPLEEYVAGVKLPEGWAYPTTGIPAHCRMVHTTAYRALRAMASTTLPGTLPHQLPQLVAGIKI